MVPVAAMMTRRKISQSAIVASARPRLARPLIRI
jgi:hypothetical protein